MPDAVEQSDFSSAIEPQLQSTGLQERLQRPPTERKDSESTIAGYTINKAADVAPATTAVIEEMHSADASTAGVTYPPAPVPIAVSGSMVPAIEQLPESLGIRRLRMGAAFVALFLAGWNYGRVAVLFVSTCLGYIAAAACTGTLSRKLGFGRALLTAVATEMIGLGLCNAYFAILRKPLLYTGFLHGIYGLGAFASPLVATAMITRGVPYHFFYLTNVGMNVPVFALIWFAFRKLHALPAHPTEPTTTSPVSTLREKRSKAERAEESIGGWIVSYVLEVRKGSPEGASWVASCFYLGLAIGRIALPTLNIFLGERRAIFIYLSFAIGLEAIAWAVPVLASTAAATALVGLAISTFYTAAITTGGRLLPRAMHADAFAFISSVGQSGSALFPLLVGIVSSKKGIWVVEPTVVALLGAQGACWYFVPKVQRRAD
ncbi:hypothetical protein EW146_g1337 [Bondarzewia mesenterica]|uniref:Major facilitator superfamily (MFS) profile domain-containing protein n=1 Tax=Bondarzewia mesenterica TaxID=1095465 RepID=A0A4V3XG37_9AGAM|nr:hypothetical protein EW146_g1337 [Bondarzewia mesenterica]